jgi:hypothetical protein
MLASHQQVQATPAPVTSPTPGVDTLNWKTYTNDAYGFSFKYPGNDWDYSQTNFAGSLNTYKFASRGNKLITINIAIDSSWNGKGGIEKTQPNSTLGGLPAYRISNPAGQNPPSEIVYVENKGKVLTIDLNYQDQSSLVQEFNQILSTFKFINPTASPSAKPVACTQEAKICPDGSSVGRTGPNCEFAPCPTP